VDEFLPLPHLQTCFACVTNNRIKKDQTGHRPGGGAAPFEKGPPRPPLGGETTKWSAIGCHGLDITRAVNRIARTGSEDGTRGTRDIGVDRLIEYAHETDEPSWGDGVNRPIPIRAGPMSPRLRHRSRYGTLIDVYSEVRASFQGHP